MLLNCIGRPSPAGAQQVTGGQQTFTGNDSWITMVPSSPWLILPTEQLPVWRGDHSSTSMMRIHAQARWQWTENGSVAGQRYGEGW